ncbi:MAG: COG1361 S-layer family protein [Candidatus Woesearchaeota archaeon]
MKKDYMIGILGLLLIIMLVPNVLAETGMSISVSKYEPYPATPGQTVKVWLLLQNTGDTDLKGITVEAISQSPFTPYNQENVKTIDLLGAHKDYLIDFNLKIDDNAVEGYNDLRIRYGFAGGTIQQKTVELYVQTRDSTLTIEDVSMEPSEISPGTDGTLTITIKNNAPSTMTDLSMKLQLQAIIGAALVDLPFAPIDSGTERRIYMLESGKSTEFQYNLRAYPDAVSKVYKIPFTLTYYDSLGNAKNKTDYVGVIVNGVPDISVIIDKTDLTMQTRNGIITLKIINKGVSDMKFLNVILKDSQDFEVLSNSDTTYVGNLVSDDYQTAEYRINVKSKENTINMPVTLQYRDANNRYYEKIFNVELNLIDSKKIESNNKGGFPWLIVIIILVIVGGIWYYFKNKNKKNKKGQFYQ